MYFFILRAPGVLGGARTLRGRHWTDKQRQCASKILLYCSSHLHALAPVASSSSSSRLSASSASSVCLLALLHVLQVEAHACSSICSLIMTNTTVNPSEVGWQFVPQYYTFVNKHPNRLHCFYTKASTFIHGTEGEDGKPCFGQQVSNQGVF